MPSDHSLPFGSEFSPNVVELPELLELIMTHAGDKSALEAALKARYFYGHSTSEDNKRKLAMNLRLSLKAYGIIGADMSITKLGSNLHSERADAPLLHKMLARHILLNLHGITMVQCIRDMQLAGETVTLTKLRHWLDERGISFPRGGKHPSIMRLWLEKAGVFSDRWRIDEGLFRELAGLAEADLEILAQLSQEQKAYLKTLVNLDQAPPFLSNEVERLASATYGIQFDEKNLPKQVLYPLQELGFITLERGTKSPGRGAKPFLISPTDIFDKEILLPVINQLEQQTHSDLRPFLRRLLREILEEMSHPNKQIRGLALEAFAIKMMRLIGLEYVATRLRGSVTAGAEVDVIFDSSRLVFTRWQVQCKNTPSVSLDDVAKEVGLTRLLKSNAIVIVSTGRIGTAARQYANRVMSDSNLAIIMLDQSDIQSISARPASIVEILRREAKHALDLKRIEI